MIPHDGRNLTVLMLVKVYGKGLNVSYEIATVLSKGGLTLSKAPQTGMFDLDDLEKHNANEHDGSLSRKDYDLGGESQAFRPSIFVETLSYFKGAKEVGIKEVAAARSGRLQTSKATNPKFLYGPGQVFNTYGESAFYFAALANATTQKASVEWIKIFFSELAGFGDGAERTWKQARSGCRTRRAGVPSTCSMGGTRERRLEDRTSHSGENL
jgi:hypothetical protein